MRSLAAKVLNKMVPLAQTVSRSELRLKNAVCVVVNDVNACVVCKICIDEQYHLCKSRKVKDQEVRPEELLSECQPKRILPHSEPCAVYCLRDNFGNIGEDLQRSTCRPVYVIKQLCHTVKRLGFYHIG